MSRHGPRLLVVAAAIVASLGAVAAPAAAGSDFTTSMDMGDRCVQVNNPPSGGNLTLIQRRGTTTLATVTKPATSGVKACLTLLKAGDKVIIKQGGATIRTVTVPGLTLKMDRAGETISISAPAGGAFDMLWLTDFIAGTFSQAGAWPVAAVTDPQNASRVVYTQDTSLLAHPMTGGDEARTIWVDGAGNVFRLRAALPSVVMMNTIWKLSGRAKNGSTPTITVRDGSVVKGSLGATASRINGRWNGTVTKNGRAVPIEPGWTIFHPEVSGAMLKALSDIPLVDITGEGTLSQPCFPNGRWVVSVNGAWRNDGDTPADGQVTLSTITNGQGDLQPGDMIDFRCENLKGGGQQFLIGLSQD